ncbi:MAG TPA: EamA family transporter [Puia sp.]|nr:EamA family transporter [Puia sp.]
MNTSSANALNASVRPASFTPNSVGHKSSGASAAPGGHGSRGASTSSGVSASRGASTSSGVSASSRPSSSSASRHPRLLVILAFTAVYIIWGTTYLAMRFGMLGIPPFMLCLFRYGLVATVLVAWMGVKNLSFPSLKNTKVLTASGLLMLVGGTGIVVTAEQYINSGATATVIATEPLMFLLMDRKNRRSYSVLTVAGIVLGFVGIFLFSEFTTNHADALSSAGSSDVWRGTVLVLISAVFWVLGALESRRQTDATHSPVASAAVQHVVGALGCLPIVLFRGEFRAFHPAQVPAAAWLGLAYLVVMGSLVAFMAYMWLMKVQPPAVVSTHTYVNPVVAVIAGWILAGETINVPQVFALAMVLFGVLIVQTRRPRIPSLRPGLSRVTRFLARNRAKPIPPHSQPWS